MVNVMQHQYFSSRLSEHGGLPAEIAAHNCISISFIRSEADNQPRAATLSKAKFINQLTCHAIRDKKSGPAFIPAVFKSGAKRQNQNVEYLTALVLDVDDGTPYSTLLERLGPYEHVFYTSHSHRPEHPKYRIVIFLEEAIPATDWPAFWQRASAYFGHMDASTKDASRLYFLPSHPKGTASEARHHSGRLLKVDDLPVVQTSRRNGAVSVPISITQKEDVGIEEAGDLKPEQGLQAVIEHCAFMQYASDPVHQNELSNPEWMAMITNACGFENSDAWIHAASEHHDGYDELETQGNIERFREKGYLPMTCASIQGLGFSGCPEGGCQTCKGKVVEAPAGLWGWFRQEEHRRIAATDVTALPSYEVGNFTVFDEGIFHSEQRDGEPPKVTQVSFVRVDVVALGRDTTSGKWGLVLSFLNLDRVRKTWVMPMEMLGSARQPYREPLFSMGVALCPGKRASELFAQFLIEARPERRVLSADRIGWHQNTFVLPDTAYGQVAEEEVVLQLADPTATANFDQAGTLSGWQQGVAGLANGNGRLMLGISLALCGPVVPLLEVENPGFNLRGPSSIGKSLTLKVAASVWGSMGFVRTWNATGNGLQSVAALHNHTFLPLDEMGEAQLSSIGNTVFSLAGGVGRTRAKQNGEHREAKRWQLAFLSTSERSLASVMAEAGQSVVAGQEVRMIEIPADPGKNFGIFDQLNGYENSRQLAVALQDGINAHHGHAGRAWIECLADPERRPEILARIRRYMSAFADQVAMHGDAGQVSRVASRFALVAAVGAACCEEGILPWTAPGMFASVRQCMDAWLDGRGGRGEMEREQAIAMVREFLMRHGSSRFEQYLPGGIEQQGQRIINRAGYVELGEDGEPVYFISADIYKNEVCARMDSKQVTRYLSEAGYLVPGATEARQRTRRLGDRMYFYAVRGSITGSTASADPFACIHRESAVL